MHLSEIMIPPLMSSVMSSQDLTSLGSGKGLSQEGGTTGKSGGSTPTTGRPAKEEGELSDKTIKNKESMK